MTDQANAPRDEQMGGVVTTDADYSAVYYHSHLGPAYDYDEPHWQTFFGNAAEAIIALFEPKTTYDAGCAKGFLVRELAARGVDAHGGDISSAAISGAPPGLAERLEVKDLTQPFDQRYELITCIEVLEHMSSHDAHLAVANMCAATDLVLLSSTPEDFAEATHVNVRQPAGWAQDFAVQGFFRRTDIDASFLSPWATVFQRSQLSKVELVTRYESHLASLSREVLEKRRALLDTQRLIDEQSVPALTELGALRADVTNLNAEIDRLRSPEILAQSAARLAIVDEVIGLRAELAEARVNQETYVEPLRQEAAAAAATIAELTSQLGSARADVGLRSAHSSGPLAASLNVQDAVAAKEQEMKGSRTWRIGRLVLLPVSLLRRLIGR